MFVYVCVCVWGSASQCVGMKLCALFCVAVCVGVYMCVPTSVYEGVCLCVLLLCGCAGVCGCVRLLRFVVAFVSMCVLVSVFELLCG